MRQVLVVANRTVGGDELAEVIRPAHAAGPCEFHLLVPVPPTPPIGVAMGFSAMEVGMIPAAQGPDEQEIAQERLQFGLEWMRGLGATVSGAVGESDAVRAVRSGARGPPRRRDHHLDAADEPLALAAPGPAAPRRAQVQAAGHGRDRHHHAAPPAEPLLSFEIGPIRADIEGQKRW